MKKTILLSSAILILAASAAAFAFAARHSNSSDSLVNANIEALTDGELSSPDWWVKEHFGGSAITCTKGGDAPCE